jgi:alkylated DNA repair dioxygenase AlkB
MDAFLQRGKRKADPPAASRGKRLKDESNDEPTDVKLARLSSLYPLTSEDMLLDVLLAHDGSVPEAIASLRAATAHSSPRKSSSAQGHQSSLRFLPDSPALETNTARLAKKAKTLSRKGDTLHLYDPDDISEHTPCTIIHNFLPGEQANDLLREMLEESKSFEKITFRVFDNVVASPHTSSFFVDNYEEQQRQQSEYVYNGAYLTVSQRAPSMPSLYRTQRLTPKQDVRRITPHLQAVKSKVAEAVNAAIQERIRTRYPGGKKLRFQSPKAFNPNAAFVNCYNGPRENVGWHSDQLTYLGPRAVIGSLSLGVAREFRVRRVLPKDDTKDDVSQKPRPQTDDETAANEGQIAIHLPHNSLLVMHAEMQEEWKHSVAPALAIDPHPVAGNRRINITYRDYRPEFHPKFTPRCRCGVPSVLRVVQRKRENWGRYFWMCHAGNVPEKKDGCTFFQWAEFDDDGLPIWNKGGKPEASPRKGALDTQA